MEYIPDIPITLKDSASLIPNNLSSWGLAGVLNYVVVSQMSITHVVAKPGGTMQKKLSSKTGSISQPIIQARFIIIGCQLYIVICTFHGIEIYTANEHKNVFCYPINQNAENPDDSVYVQGISNVNVDEVAVGLYNGKILILKKDGHTFKMGQVIQGHKNPICDICNSSKSLFTSDDNGCVLVWNYSDSTWKLKKTFEGAGSPCSTLAAYKDYVVGGYGSGHIRIFDHNKGQIVCEITAHARWINAINVNGFGNLISVSEDTVINIWSLKNFTLLHSFSLPNVQLCGVQFLQGSDDFALTGYDMKDIMIFRRAN